MPTSKLLVSAVCGLIVIAGVGVVAQSGSIRLGDRGLMAPMFAGQLRAGGPTRVIGTVIDIRMIPVAAVRVQLRNLANGTVQQAQETNEAGEYDFPVDDPSTYVVEMALTDGQVIALSNAGSLARNDTLRTVIQLPGRWDTLRGVVLPPNAVNFMGLGSAQTMTSATIQVAADLSIAPVNSGEPVSAFVPQQ
ncbi:MAG: hypothetical protein ACKOEC_00490 [Acidimicrobiia bacterium]